MNIAAATTFTLVMFLGMTGLTGLVYRDRRRTTPPDDTDPLDADLWPPPSTVYDAVVLELGDPRFIDFTAPTPAW